MWVRAVTKFIKRVFPKRKHVIQFEHWISIRSLFSDRLINIHSKQMTLNYCGNFGQLEALLAASPRPFFTEFFHKNNPVVAPWKLSPPLTNIFHGKFDFNPLYFPTFISQPSRQSWIVLIGRSDFCYYIFLWLKCLLKLITWSQLNSLWFLFYLRLNIKIF